VRSTRFEIDRRGDAYTFEGSGHGHGVGMSQYGARGQAQAGRTYRDILAFYFAGTRVEGGPAGAPRAAVAGASVETPRVPTPRRPAPPTWTTSEEAPKAPARPRRRAW
jgi:stage II sporulation protein D